MSTLSIEEIKGILISGEFEQFISQKESEIFEAKSKRPYIFPEKKAIREFIKDVTSLANNKGGFVLFGLETEKAQDSPIDYVNALDLVSKEDFYEGALLKGIANSNIHPRLGVEVSWYPSKEDNNLGLGVVYIPEQDESKKYYIIKVAEIEGEDTREFFGIPIRNDCNTRWLQINELYKLSKRAPNNLQEAYQSLTNQINEVKEMISNYSSAQVSDTDDIVNKIEETIDGR